MTVIFDATDGKGESDPGRAVDKTAKKVGRPGGKRSDPEYIQVTAYIKQDTHKRVKISLIENEGGDFSELIERLLNKWLNTQNAKK